MARKHVCRWLWVAPGFARPAVLMLCAAGGLNARWQKTFLLNLYLLIDTQGRGAHGPDERGLERLFTHNVKLYNCAAGMRETTENFNTKPKTPRRVAKALRERVRWDG